MLFKRWRRKKAEQAQRAEVAPSNTQPPRRSRPSPPTASGVLLRSDAAISVRGLRKSYAGFEAVCGVDFDVERGEIVAFLGPNGAGKTTTVEILEGYRKRSAGELRVLGEDPAEGGAEWRDRIGVVLQESEPEAYLTARQCLRLYAGYYSRPRRVDETLALVGLEGKADSVASTLSGGQRRRLDVALALIGDPQLVFLDEPTTGFDPSARRTAWDVIAGLRDLGKTIFLTTHYMDEAEFLADRIIVLSAGEIVAEGTPATLGGRDRSSARITFTLPRHLGVADMPAPFDAAAVIGVGLVEAKSTRPLADLRALHDWAEAQGVDLPDIEVRRPTLEDVYLELTGATVP
ncbi:MAG TPA: ABC transporter ATP-binding protein [Gaiellaceae bacterium]